MAAEVTEGVQSPTALDVHIRLVCGGITNVEVPVVIGARYDRLAFAGPTKAFDQLLDSWMTRAVDLGIIGSELGQLFPINLELFHKAGKLKARNLLLAGMGEPGRFAQDSLRFVFSNIVVAVKAMGENEFATSLLGTRRNELSIGDAVRGLIQGIHDGYERILAITNDVTEDKESLRSVAEKSLSIRLVHSDRMKLTQIREELKALSVENLSTDSLPPRVNFTIDPDDFEVAADPKTEVAAVDVEPDRVVTYLRVTRSKSAARAIRGKPVLPAKQKKPPAHPGVNHFPTDVYQFSALSDVAVVPQREQEVNTRLMRDLPDRLTKDCEPNERANYATFFTNLLIPDDFRKLTEGSADLTLEVDDTTAVLPWEMAAQERYSRASYISRNVAVSRQFRSLLSPPQTSPPALDNKLKALIIADPAGDELALPHARAEGAAVVEVLEQARIAWGSQYEISATVRIGPKGDEDAGLLLKNLAALNGCVESVDICDPLELAMLMVNRQFDLIHYAGHGVADPTGQTGWVFAGDCVLSAKEIFRIRQVPRLVFANACFSAVTADHNEQREHMAGLAQAFFARGIPNYIGAGWKVDDTCAAECAKWFYARVLGLRTPSASTGTIGEAPPATIGIALRDARARAFARNPYSSSWGAYQHYGHVNDKLLAMVNAPPATATLADAQSAEPGPADTSEAKTATDAQAGGAADLVYVNGFDVDTGKPFAPRSIGEIAKSVHAGESAGSLNKVRGGASRSLPVDMDPTKLEETGWAILFHEDTPKDVRDALAPLMALRKTQASARYRELPDYRKGEQTRDWYARNATSPGNFDPGIVPYYLLLIGPPDLIPFEFQYLLGVEYAVGRLAFDTAEEYSRYANSTVAYEKGKSTPNTREVHYWGTRHAGDGATNLSASLLVDPLANGIPASAGALKQAINSLYGFDRKLCLGDDATKANLLQSLHATKPPAMLFTASHGLAMRSGQDKQLDIQGALLCQDWPGFGNMRPEHCLAATDIADDANVNGMVALLFACFGAGTPDTNQFLKDLSQAGDAPPLAPKPFIAALPRRLLAHPKGSALAVIGHVDQAWGFSMQDPKVAGPQIAAFRNSIGTILSGAPVGHAMSKYFGAKFAELSALLLNATSPTASAAMKLNDHDLAVRWIERNDAQNYLLLGDPAVRIRKDGQA
jgi:predicted DNA-binding ArsR family transcriptional regulator